MKTFIDNTNKYYITRVSRWIGIKQAYNITSRHSLYDFATDENGYNTYSDKYNPENGNFLDYFVFGGRKYALSQFISLGSAWCGGSPYFFTDTDGKTTVVGAVDFYGDLYNPLYIELDECCERVRVYEIELVNGCNYHLWEGVQYDC